MDRRRVAVLLMIVLVSSSSLIIYFSLVPSHEGDDPTSDNEIQLHPYNRLNWWDIAWDLSEPADFDVILSRLSAFGPRDIASPGHDQAVDLFEENLNILNITTSFWGIHNTLVGYQEGYGSDNRAIVFGAHIDTWNIRGVITSSGINQNGAGCAVLMMIAETLSKFRLPIDIYYCFYEGGHDVVFSTVGINPVLYNMLGSKDVANKFLADETEIIAVYNFDDLLYVDPDTPDATRFNVEYTFGSYGKTKYLADIFSSFMFKTGDNLIDTVLERTTNSDHQSFWEHGYPAVNVKTGHHAMNDYYVPATEDLIGNPNFDLEQAPLIARAAAATAIYLGSKGNGHKTSFRLDVDIGPNNSSTIHTALSVAQTVFAHGTIPADSQLTIETGNGTIDYSSHQVSGEFYISFEVPQTGPLQINVRNEAAEPVTIEMYLDYSSDIDGNGALDSDQYSWPDPDPILDWDHDSLGDEDERIAGTDIFDFDTDKDTISDGLELDLGLNPLRDDSHEDADNDTISNIMEIQYGTLPLNNDTDSDKIDDGWEILFHTDPLVNDSHLDLDGDTLTNYEEYLHGADPQSADGDNDGILDVVEISIGTDPLNDDSDFDGINDNIELLDGLDPLVADFDHDLADDGDDHNPRINFIFTISALVLVPVFLGYLILRRRIMK